MDELERDELEFLRFYFKKVQHSLGACDADINCDIVKEYKAKTGKSPGPKYDHSDEEED